MHCLRCLIALIAIMLWTAAVSADELRYHRVSTERSYDDVLEDVRFAIAEHNFRLTGGNRIGGAIGDRRGKPFPRSQIVHFCNLEYARQFLEPAPDYLLHMPCKIVVYESEAGIEVIARLLAEDDERVVGLARKVNQILRDIVDYAVEE